MGRRARSDEPAQRVVRRSPSAISVLSAVNRSRAGTASWYDMHVLIDIQRGARSCRNLLKSCMSICWNEDCFSLLSGVHGRRRGLA